jgi:hypothetical protein
MLEALEPLSLEQFTQELGGSFGSVRNTAVHTLSAECVWLLRWKGENPPGMLAPVGYPDLAAVRHAWIDNEAKMRQFFEPMDEAGLQKVIPYKTFAGLGNCFTVVADAAARGESRFVSPGSGHHAAPATRGGAAQRHGPHRVLSRESLSCGIHL